MPEQPVKPVTPAVNAENKPVNAASSADNKAAPGSSVDPNAGRTKYVVNGKEVYLTPEQAHAYVQKGLAFEPKMSELARLQKETQSFLQTLREDPAKILFNENFGASPNEVLQKIMHSTKVSDATKDLVGQWYYDNVIAPQQMSPEARELADAKRRLSEIETQKKKEAEVAASRQQQYMVQQALGELKAKIGEAMKDSGLPDMNTPLGITMARRVADAMKVAWQEGQPITPKQAIEHVRREMSEYYKTFYDSLDEDKLIEALGKETAEKVRKHFLKQVKEKEKEKTTRDNTNFKPIKRDERKTITPDDFHEYLDNLKKTGK